MSTFAEPIMPWKTKKEWKTESSAGFFTKRKNQSLLEVDEHFEAWLTANAAHNFKDEFKALNSLILSTQAWLHAKAKKKKSTRRPAMEKMLKAAMQRLLWVSYWKQKELGKPESRKLAELRGLYKIEAASAPKGQDRVSADKLVMSTKKDDLGRKAISNPDVLDQITDEQLTTYASDLLSVALDKPNQVILKYMTLGERAELQLIFLDDSNGVTKVNRKAGDNVAPLSTKWRSTEDPRTKQNLGLPANIGFAHAWVADKYGNFYSDQPKAHGTFHHSSFTSGQGILCGGMLVCEQGQLVYIDNGSGHYKPTKDTLLDALDTLKNVHGLDISHTAVGLVTSENNKTYLEEWASADAFLESGGGGTSRGKVPLG